MAQVVADPIADKSAILKSELSKQPETLVAYAKWYGKVAGPITNVELSAIDAKVTFVNRTTLLWRANSQHRA